MTVQPVHSHLLYDALLTHQHYPFRIPANYLELYFPMESIKRVL